MHEFKLNTENREQFRDDREAKREQHREERDSKREKPEDQKWKNGNWNG